MGDEVHLTSNDVLFVGNGRSPICWYRAALPAIYMGCDWVGVDDNFNMGAGIVRGGTQLPKLDDYRIVVWQQPRSPHARKLMRSLQQAGIKVIIDCDDYLEGVRKSKDHDFRNEMAFSKKEMANWQKTMLMADGLIVSTDWLAKKYSQFNENVWVCKNGLDMGRYDKQRTDHSPRVNIGWAGATGHVSAFLPIMDAVERVMIENPNTNFISIGQPFANEFASRGIDSKRLVSVPWTSIELYPNAMTMFDIALAPARGTNWYRAKSQLRYYEAAAVGAATIGTGWLYDEIIDGITGIKIEDGTTSEWYRAISDLVTDGKRRTKMQRIARRVAFEEFNMRSRIDQWVAVLDAVSKQIVGEKHGDPGRADADGPDDASADRDGHPDGVEHGEAKPGGAGDVPVGNTRSEHIAG